MTNKSYLNLYECKYRGSCKRDIFVLNFQIAGFFLEFVVNFKRRNYRSGILHKAKQYFAGNLLAKQSGNQMDFKVNHIECASVT